MSRPPRAPRQPDPEPLEVDEVRVVTVGTVLWAIAAIVTFVLRGRLEDAGHGWWPWTCLAGVGLGLLGIEYCRRRRTRR